MSLFCLLFKTTFLDVVAKQLQSSSHFNTFGGKYFDFLAILYISPILPRNKTQSTMRIMQRMIRIYDKSLVTLGFTFISVETASASYWLPYSQPEQRCHGTHRYVTHKRRIPSLIFKYWILVGRRSSGALGTPMNAHSIEFR